MMVIPVLIFAKNSRSFVAEISAPWQHCLSGYRFLIGKSMQLEKTDTAKSKIGAARSKRYPQKHLAHQQVPSQCGVHFEMRCRQYTHMLNLLYEETLKIDINILRRYRNFMFVQENHQQASPVS
jgi:hypothetical protein